MSKRSKHNRHQSGTNEDGPGSTPPSNKSQPRKRIAVFGGDGRRHPYAESQGDVRYFPSPGNGGNGGVKRLEESLKSGGIELVLVLTRWNGHSATKRIRRLCAQLGVPFERLK